MVIISRIKRIISANLNSLVEKAEDPESLIRELIREMDASIIRLRGEVTRSIAAEKRLARQLEGAEKKVRLWQENSEKAVSDKDDDLARKALARKLQEERKCADLEEGHVRAKESCAQLKAQLCQLEDKVQEARRKKELLISRKRSAESRKAMLNATRDFASAARRSDELLADSGLSASDACRSLEDQVVTMETEAEAMGELVIREPSLEAVFEKSKMETEIERQLAALKDKLKK